LFPAAGEHLYQVPRLPYASVLSEVTGRRPGNGRKEVSVLHPFKEQKREKGKQKGERDNSEHTDRQEIHPQSDCGSFHYSVIDNGVPATYSLIK
jgi:hypothetical protein